MPKQSAPNGKRGDVAYLPNTRKGFYEKTKNRMITETPIGSRYYSMFALAIIAYKCRVPFAQLERDLEFIRDSYNERDQRAHKVKRSEVAKAIGLDLNMTPQSGTAGLVPSILQTCTGSGVMRREIRW